eukprot:12127-Heterococcus_DN1.PRE.3
MPARLAESVPACGHSYNITERLSARGNTLLRAVCCDPGGFRKIFKKSGCDRDGYEKRAIFRDHRSQKPCSAEMYTLASRADMIMSTAVLASSDSAITNATTRPIAYTSSGAEHQSTCKPQ